MKANLRKRFGVVSQFVLDGSQNFVLNEIKHSDPEENFVVMSVQMFAIIFVQVSFHVKFFISYPLDGFFAIFRTFLFAFATATTSLPTSFREFWRRDEFPNEALEFLVTSIRVDTIK